MVASSEKANAKKASAKAKSKAASSTNQDPLAAQKPAKRRQLGRRHSDEKADRAIALHCASVTRQRVESSIDSQGRSLSQRVLQNTRALPSKTHRLGAGYWKRIRTELGFTDSQVGVKVLDVNQEVGDDVIAAPKSCTDKSSSSRCVGPLTQLLAFRSHLNQREFCGIVSCTNTLAETSLINRSVQSQLWVDVLKAVTRLNDGECLWLGDSGLASVVHDLPRSCIKACMHAPIRAARSHPLVRRIASHCFCSWVSVELPTAPNKFGYVSVFVFVLFGAHVRATEANLHDPPRHRLEMQKRLATELTACRSVMDDALGASWTRSKKAGVSLRTFLTCHQKPLTVWMDAADLETVMSNAGDVDKCEAHLRRLCASLRCGATLFSDLTLKIAGRVFSNALHDELSALDSPKDAAAYEETKGKLVKLAAVEVERNPRSKACCTIQWLTKDLDLDGLTPHSEWNMLDAAKAKQSLLETDERFTRLPWEQWLLPPVKAYLACFRGDLSALLGLTHRRGGFAPCLH